MARLPVVDGDLDAWGGILNDYLEVGHNGDGTHKYVVAAVASGDVTGATDTANVQNAVNAIVAANTYYGVTGCLHLAAGQYHFSSSINISASYGFRVVGDGAWATSIITTPAMAGLPVFLCTDCHEPSFSDFSIAGNADYPPSYGVQCNVSASPPVASTHLQLTHMSFGGPANNQLVYGWGFTTSGPDNNNDQSCVIDSDVVNTTHGFYIGHSNSEMHRIIGGNWGTTGDAVVAAGGGFTIIGTNITTGASGYMFNFGAGTYRRGTRIIGINSETNGLFLTASASAAGLDLHVIGSNFAGGPAGSTIVDFEPTDLASELRCVDSRFDIGQTSTAKIAVARATFTDCEMGFTTIQYGGPTSIVGCHTAIGAGGITTTNLGSGSLILSRNTGGGLAGQQPILLTLKNSWVNGGSPYASAQCWLDADGVVHLTGRISGGANGTIAFTLPNGFYRGGWGDRIPVVAESSGAAYLAVDGNGNCAVTSCSGTLTGTVMLNGATLWPGWTS
jgi:hypothetical protein